MTTFVAGTPPNSTVIPWANPRPVMRTGVPPGAGPWGMLMPATRGPEVPLARTVRGNEPTLCPSNPVAWMRSVCPAVALTVTNDAWAPQPLDEVSSLQPLVRIVYGPQAFPV